jgi:hypothetical protein
MSPCSASCKMVGIDFFRNSLFAMSRFLIAKILSLIYENSSSAVVV